MSQLLVIVGSPIPMAWRGPSDRGWDLGWVRTLVAGGQPSLSEASYPDRNVFINSLHLVKTAGNNVILVFRGQLAEIAAPAPDAHDQVLVILRMSLGVQQGLHIQAVEL